MRIDSQKSHRHGFGIALIFQGVLWIAAGLLIGRYTDWQIDAWVWLLFCVGAVNVTLGALMATGEPYFECYGTIFRFGGRVDAAALGIHSIMEFERTGIDDKGNATIFLSDGRRIKIPERLQEHSRLIAEALEAARRLSVDAAALHSATATLCPPEAWPDPFLHQYREVTDRAAAVQSYDDAIIHDPNALRALIARYRKSVRFHRALPPAFELAKMFTALRESNGGLVLLGVSPDGSIAGLDEEALRRAREKLEHLAANLTEARVEIGRIELQGKAAAFAIFNIIPSHLRPMEPFAKATSEVVVV